MSSGSSSFPPSTSSARRATNAGEEAADNFRANSSDPFLTPNDQGIRTPTVCPPPPKVRRTEASFRRRVSSHGADDTASGTELSRAAQQQRPLSWTYLTPLASSSEEELDMLSVSEFFPTAPRRNVDLVVPRVRRLRSQAQPEPPGRLSLSPPSRRSVSRPAPAHRGSSPLRDVPATGTRRARLRPGRRGRSPFAPLVVKQTSPAPGAFFLIAAAYPGFRPDRFRGYQRTQKDDTRPW